MTMKKLISLALVLVLVLGLAAGLGGSAFAADNRILYHIHNSMPYVTLDPSIEYSNGIMVLQNVYETLTHYDPETGEVVPMLATSWSSNEDGTVWVFQLRDDVTFHDGSKLTAQQVVNSFKRTMDLGQGGAYIWDAVLEENGGSVEATGEYEVTRSRHYEVTREGTISFSRVPVDASSKMPDDLMDSIEPFDYRAITDFSLAYMPGYLANKYDVSKQECGKRAEERSVKSARNALRATVTGYTSVSTRTHHEKVYNEKTEYAVFPVWLLSTKWEDQTFLFAMNGQTGKMTGNLPVSKLKQLLWFIAVFAVSLIVFGSFLLTGEDVTTTSYLLAALFSFVPAFIVNAVLCSQMKPVAQLSQASAYVAEGGMHLRARDDRYIRTTESRVKIQNAQPPGGGKGPGKI